MKTTLRILDNRYVRPQYGCTCCQRVVSGDMPAHIAPKGMAEASLIAQLVISKHCDHMPLYRQQSVMARSDIHLPVSTMADMVGRAGAALTPLAESLHRMLLTCDVLHADETPLQSKRSARTVLMFIPMSDQHSMGEVLQHGYRLLRQSARAEQQVRGGIPERLGRKPGG